MLKNYLKIALRYLKRFKIYTAINLLSLALGLTAGILILLFVTDELSYDQFHQNKNRIYKVITTSVNGGPMETNAWPLGYQLKEEYPEVESSVYLKKAPSNVTLYTEGKRYQHTIYYTNNEFFNTFSFDLIEGDPNSALIEPYAIVITEEVKKQYFGNANVVGNTLTLQDSLDFKITGVIANPPSQSHIQFDMLVSMATYEDLGFSYTTGWGNFTMVNYILLHQDAKFKQFESKSNGIYMDSKHEGEIFKKLGKEFVVKYIPFSDVYLNSPVPNRLGSNGSIDKVYLVSCIALFVILLACINFVNLTTARSVYRAKEVGLRKIVGSSRTSLIAQFLSEAFILTTLSFCIAVLLIDLSLPFFNQLMDKQYEFNSLINGSVISGTAILLIAVSALSGYYPALVISSYKPIDVVKGSLKNSTRGIGLRRALVIFQFFISGAIVLGTIVIIKQLNYMRNQDLGFDKEQILVLDATRIPKTKSIQVFKTRVKSLTAVENVSFTNALPSKPGWQGQWAYPEVMDENKQVDTEYMAIDENYLETLGLELLAGENFDLDKPGNLEDGLIINETTVEVMGWQTPEIALGKKIVSPSHRPQGTVIGVVKDFHGEGLQSTIWPQAMDYSSEQYGRYIAIRFVSGQTSQLISELEHNWKEAIGDYTFEYSFLNQDFDKQYRSEERLMSVFVLFAVITVFIAVVGLLGLVSFMVLSRTKEIGVRKVLGANVFSIAALLSKEFAILVIIANLISIPLLWYYGEKWLSDFAYRTAIEPSIFLISFTVTLLVAIAAISFQTIKAAMMNPVETLRNE